MTSSRLPSPDSGAEAATTEKPLDEWARSRPTRCPESGGPLYRATDAHVVVCWDDGCHRDFVVGHHNDYLLAAPHYAAAITNGPRVEARHV